MFSSQQCELARVMTNSKTTDEEINKEYAGMSDELKYAAFRDIEPLVKENKLPFDKGMRPRRILCNRHGMTV